MGMKLKIRKHNDNPVIEVHGKVSSEDAIKISKKLEGFAKRKHTAVVIDLSAIDYIDSHWLGVFVYSWKLLKERDTDLVFAIPSGFIRDLFRNSNLDRTFTIVNSLDELAA
ncbi:MAG: anti-sigma factor antagonist [Chitinivibrionales bacterium]|nr:anti-sigma factor antagonist [Chitinivibrionales bacterium]